MVNYQKIEIVVLNLLFIGWVFLNLLTNYLFLYPLLSLVLSYILLKGIFSHTRSKKQSRKIFSFLLFVIIVNLILLSVSIFLKSDYLVPQIAVFLALLLSIMSASTVKSVNHNQ
jgi:hypothetical protein